eukprot:457423_1
MVMFGLCGLAGWFDLHSFCYYLPYTLLVLCPCNALLDRFFVFSHASLYTISAVLDATSLCLHSLNVGHIALYSSLRCCNFAAHSVKIDCIGVISVWCFTLHLFN